MPAPVDDRTADQLDLAPDERESIELVQTLGRALHRYGAPANRLEDVLTVLSSRLGLRAEFFSTPTSIFYAYDLPGGRHSVRLQRVHGNELDLSKLARLDALADAVLARRVGLAEARAEVGRIVDDRAPYPALATVAAFAVVSGVAGAFFGGGGPEMLAGGLCGLALAATYFAARGSERLGRLFEPLAALVVSLTALLVAEPLDASWSRATLAGLIVLVPGFSLTIGATELALNHPASGTARLATAMTTLLMLTMGVVLGRQIGTDLLGLDPVDAVGATAPDWVVLLGLLGAGLSLGVLFRTAPRDLPWSVVAVVLPFVAFELGLGEIGRDASVFLGGLLAGCFANLFARVFRRPSMIVRLPGVLILVPGATGLLSLEHLAGGDAQAGVENFFRVAMTATALVAGFFVSNAVLPPRRVL